MVKLSELREAVGKMTEAADRLRPFIQHTCMLNKTDGPDGDCCTRQVGAAIRQANAVLAKLHELGDWQD